MKVFESFLRSVIFGDVFVVYVFFEVFSWELSGKFQRLLSGIEDVAGSKS